MKLTYLLIILVILISLSNAQSCDCRGKKEFPTQAFLNRGILDDGNETNLRAIDGIMMNISEVSGMNGIELNLTIENSNLTTGVYWNFTTIVHYSANVGPHHVHIEVWNGTDWFHINHLDASPGLLRLENSSIGLAEYINDDNEIQLRFSHPFSGNPNHDLFIDYVSITEVCILQENIILIKGDDQMGYEIASVLALLGLTGIFFYLGWKIKKTKLLGFMFNFLAFLMIATLLFNMIVFSSESGTWTVDQMTKVGDNWVLNYTQQGALPQLKDLYQTWFFVLEMIIFVIIAWFFTQFMGHRIEMINKYQNPNGPTDGEIEFDPLE